MPTAKLDLIGLVVEDLARSLAFYRRLGLDIPPEADTAPHVETTLPGGLRLAWDPVATIRSFDSSWQPPAGSPRVALAFLCSSPAEVDALYAELVAAGAAGHLEPFDAPWGQRYATVHDPDGNGVDLFAPSA
jgi:catechol 2,3-dioxygenase-like lactoylglutathione lyase family enzyme